MNTTDISIRIRDLREGNALSQNELAKELSVKQQTIAQWENGERAIKSEAIIKIAKFFNVTTDYLLGLTDSTSTDISEIGIANKTGLSSETINAIINAHPDIKRMLDLIVSNILNSTIIDCMYYLKDNNKKVTELCRNGTLHSKLLEDEDATYSLIQNVDEINGTFILKEEYSELLLFEIQNAIMKIVKKLSGYDDMIAVKEEYEKV